MARGKQNNKMQFNILIGGKAGQGPNTLADVVSKGIITKGYNVFNSREYQSIIRGGHSYNIVSFSNLPLASNHKSIDILVCLDENTEKIHKDKLNKKALILKDHKNNMFFAGALFKILDLDFKVLEQELKQLKRNFEQNMKNAKQGYASEKRSLKIEKIMQKKPLSFMSGSEAIAQASVKSGLDIYYSYPMTPATLVMMEITQLMKNKENKHLAIELEGEIAVINAAIGSSIVGAKSMVGTSGGGFDLMTEALSLCGQAEVPLVVYLASRPGPSTGMPTYTSQGDLNLARHSGHGEFSRVVLTPGDAKEAIQLTTEAFYLSQKFRIPVIILGDKHLAESKYTFIDNVKILESKGSVKIGKRFNSYEHDLNTGIATDDIEIANKNFERRIRKQKEIEKECLKFQQFKIHGKKESKNLVIGWGSTKGAILDAITYNNLDCKFIQLLYIEPFSSLIKKELEKVSKIIIIENNSTSPLSSLIAEKTGTFIEDKNKILKYDGRPFFSDELAEEIKKRLIEDKQKRKLKQ